jgi:hypothetical protein
MTIGAFAREPPRPPARTACGSAKKADAVLRINVGPLEFCVLALKPLQFGCLVTRHSETRPGIDLCLANPHTQR